MAPSKDETEVERIVRLETKLDFIISQMQMLPPSPVCVAHHREFETRIMSLEAWRNKAIGALMIINIVMVIVVEKILTFFGVK
jgi:hypothetical protein